MKTSDLKKEKKTEDLNSEIPEEPENFYIISNHEGLEIKSEKTWNEILNSLKNVQKNENLAHFYSTFQNDINDLTEK